MSMEEVLVLFLVVLAMGAGVYISFYLFRRLLISYQYRIQKLSDEFRYELIDSYKNSTNEVEKWISDYESMLRKIQDNYEVRFERCKALQESTVEDFENVRNEVAMFQQDLGDFAKLQNEIIKLKKINQRLRGGK